MAVAVGLAGLGAPGCVTGFTYVALTEPSPLPDVIERADAWEHAEGLGYVLHLELSNGDRRKLVWVPLRDELRELHGDGPEPLGARVRVLQYSPENLEPEERARVEADGGPFVVLLGSELALWSGGKTQATVAVPVDTPFHWGALGFALLCPFTAALDLATFPVSVPLFFYFASDLGVR